VTQSEDRREQSVYISGRPAGSTVLPALHTSQTEVHVRPFVKGGWKFYVSDRAFMTTDLKFGLHSGVSHVLWRNAVGFDFEWSPR
jgi:hypothetical protein